MCSHSPAQPWLHSCPRRGSCRETSGPVFKHLNSPSDHRCELCFFLVKANFGFPSQGQGVRKVKDPVVSVGASGDGAGGRTYRSLCGLPPQTQGQQEPAGGQAHFRHSHSSLAPAAPSAPARNPRSVRTDWHNLEGLLGRELELGRSSECPSYAGALGWRESFYKSEATEKKKKEQEQERRSCSSLPPPLPKAGLSGALCLLLGLANFPHSRPTNLLSSLSSLHRPLPASGEFEYHSATASHCTGNLRGSDAQLFEGGKL